MDDLIEAVIADTAAGLIGWDGNSDEARGMWRGLPTRVLFQVEDKAAFVKSWSIARHEGILSKLKDRARG